ncbi:DDE-1 domain-containing protein [Trichonephila clavipes]|nr:DDE-1 domain-containing protein [Trichonephila clavipes]
MDNVRKTPAVLDFPIVLLEEFIAVHYDSVRTASVRTNIYILEFVRSSKSIIDVDSDDESEKNNAASVPTSSRMRDVVKRIRSYLNAHSNGEMNKKIDDIEQIVDNLMLKTM